MILENEISIKITLLNLIEDLLYKGNEENFATLSFDEEYYIQLAGGKGTTDLYCEAVSNYYLKKEHLYLSQTQKETLGKLGWQRTKSGAGNYYQTRKVRDDKGKAALVALLYKTMKEVYGQETLNLETISLHLGE